MGKNKLVDRLLGLLNMEREYIQLHRDTSVQARAPYMLTYAHVFSRMLTYADVAPP